MRGKRVILPDLPLKFVPLLPRLLPRWLMLALTDVTRRIKRPREGSETLAAQTPGVRAI